MPALASDLNGFEKNIARVQKQSDIAILNNIFGQGQGGEDGQGGHGQGGGNYFPTNNQQKFCDKKQQLNNQTIKQMSICNVHTFSKSVLQLCAHIRAYPCTKTPLLKF